MRNFAFFACAGGSRPCRGWRSGEQGPSCGAGAVRRDQERAPGGRSQEGRLAEPARLVSLRCEEPRRFVDNLVGRDHWPERPAPAWDQRPAPVQDRRLPTRSTSIPTVPARTSASSIRSPSRTASTSRSVSRRRKPASRRRDSCARSIVGGALMNIQGGFHGKARSTFAPCRLRLQPPARCSRLRLRRRTRPDFNGIWGGGIAQLTPTTLQEGRSTHFQTRTSNGSVPAAPRAA